jgi:50S ribosomal protein L16 3-hydroxylase
MKRTLCLGNLTTRAFLNRYWQKSPRLIRKAFPKYVSPVSADELAGLASEQGVESRLVIKIDKKPGWRVCHGPFKRKDFHSLPRKKWTLLVQDADKQIPELADFLSHFDFIPKWRIDDLMISFAADGGSVGPHVDAYDVFLLQVQGQRRWRISKKHHAPLAKPGLELSLVRDFRPQHEWLLEPGDMLYLPPGVVHHGIAVGDSMTFSIGFRAPTDAEMLADLSSMMLERLNKDQRYTDPELTPADANPDLITSKARGAIRSRIRNLLSLSSSELDEWFGCFITQPKDWLAPVPRRHPLTANAFQARLIMRKKLARDQAARVAWYGNKRSQKIKLFVNGSCHTLPTRSANIVITVCKQHSYDANTLLCWAHDRTAITLLTKLYNQGLMYFP